jgi:rubrerythrin
MMSAAMVAVMGLTVVAASPGMAAGTADGASTLQTASGVNAAYTAETAAAAKYGAYAQQVAKNGNAPVAMLFRAMAHSKQVTAHNLETLMVTHYGGVVSQGAYTGTPGTTLEVIQDAIKTEAQKRDLLYPSLIKQARMDGELNVLGVITFAHHSTAEQVYLLKDALKSLGHNQGTRYYLVCPRCGAIVKTPTRRTFCPGCRLPIGKMDRVW